MGLSRGLSLPHPTADHRLQKLRQVVLHLLLAALTAALIMGIGLSGMLVAMAPRLLSECVEPLSLLLLPGLFIAIVSAGTHDFLPEVVVRAAAIFWFLAAFLFFTWRARTPNRT